MPPDPLVQVSKRTGTIERVRDGETPVVELRLAEGQYIAGFDLQPHVLFYDQSTVLRSEWTAYVVTPLGVTAGG